MDAASLVLFFGDALPTDNSGLGVTGCFDVCPAGSYCPDSPATPLPCPAGSACAQCATAPTLCDAGSYSGVGAFSCTPCASAGFYCPAGSTSPTSTPCPAGRFGSAAGLPVSACSGPCAPGYYCPAGATSPTHTLCPAGSFCPLGSGAPTPCPAGTYGSSAGLSSPACTGNCSALPGTYCAAGSTAPIVAPACPIGSRCAGGSAVPVPCYPASACAVAGLSAQPSCFWRADTYAGNGSASSSDGAAALASINSPRGVDVLASTGVVFASDFYGNRVVSISPGGYLRTLAGSGEAGSTDGPGTNATFDGPFGVAVNSSGFVFVSEYTSGSVRVVLPSGDTGTIAIPGTFLHPRGLAVAGSLLYIAVSGDGGSGQVFSHSMATGACCALVAGSGAYGFSNGAALSAAFTEVEGVGVGLDGAIYIADYSNYLVRLLSNGTVTTFAGTGPVPMGRGAAGSANGPATGGAQFNAPYGLAVDRTNTVFVADSVNSALRGISKGSVTTLLGGSPGFADGFGASARLDAPMAVAVIGSTGALFIADSGNNRVRNASCVPCPTSYYCSTGAPLLCPAGSYCPLGSLLPIACEPAIGCPVAGRSTPPCFWKTSTLAGSGLPGAADGPASTAQFSRLQGVAVDGATGFVYASDFNVGLRTISPAGDVSTVPLGLGELMQVQVAPDSTAVAVSTLDLIWGLRPNGTLGSIRAGGLQPMGLALNGTSGYFVASTSTNCVLYVGAAGQGGYVFAGDVNSGNVTGSYTSDGQGTMASFNWPSGLAFDSTTQQLYVIEIGFLRVVNSSRYVSTLASDVPSYFSDRGGVSIAIDSQYVYVPAASILCYSRASGEMSELIGVGSGFADGFTPLFSSPQSVALDSQGNLYVADYGNYRIRKAVCLPECPASYECSTGVPKLCPGGYFCPLGTIKAQRCPVGTASAPGSVACTLCPVGTYSAAGAPECSPCPPGTTCAGGAAPPVNCPIGFYCPDGALPPVPCYPTTACTIVALSSQPPCVWSVSSLAGNGTGAFADGAAALLSGPAGVAVGPRSSTVFVGDLMNNRVRAVSPAGQVSTLAGSGMGAFNDDLGAAASFSYPFGVAVDALENVYVADGANNRLRKILPSGAVSTLAGNGAAGGANGIGAAAQLSRPTSFALNSNGTTGYIVEELGSRIRSYNVSTGAVAGFAGSGVAGFADSPVGALAQFDGPTTAVWHPNGFLYVADGWGGCPGCGNHRIRAIHISSSAVSTLAGSNSSGSLDGVGTAATFIQPRGLALDATFATLYVSDAGSHTIRAIWLSTARVQTIVGSGAASYVDGFSVAAALNAPLQLSFSPGGIMYAADAANNRIRRIACVPCPPAYYIPGGGGGGGGGGGFGSGGVPMMCPAGSYCPASSSGPILCPAGTYGSVTMLTAPTCSGNCQLGYWCPAGSTQKNANGCPVGTFCPMGTFCQSCPVQVVGATAPTPCTPGYCEFDRAVCTPAVLPLPQLSHAPLPPTQK